MQQALNVETDVLVAVLKQNKASHGRTKYFQRTQMALKAVRKVDVGSVLKRIRSLIQSSKNAEWSVAEDEKRSKEMNEIKEIVLSKFPEILSRIVLACRSITYEMSRGFYLNLHVVLFGAIARIRAITMKMGEASLRIMHAEGIVDTAEHENTMKHFVKSSEAEKLTPNPTEEQFDHDKSNSQTRSGVQIEETAMTEEAKPSKSIALDRDVAVSSSSKFETTVTAVLHSNPTEIPDLGEKVTKDSSKSHEEEVEVDSNQLILERLLGSKRKAASSSKPEKKQKKKQKKSKKSTTRDIIDDIFG